MIHRNGFSLVELLIVIAILGILAALVIPNLTQFLESGKIGAGRSEKSNLQVAVDGMMADAGVTALTGGDVADWQGETGAVVETVDGIDYDAGDYVRRSPTTGEFLVAADGEVTCTAYEDLDAEALDRINA